MLRHYPKTLIINRLKKGIKIALLIEIDFDKYE